MDSLTRRELLQAAAAVSVLSGAGVPALARSGDIPLDEAFAKGAAQGVRYDGERQAFLLVGEPGAYAAEGSITSAAVALGSRGRWQAKWHPRWTTPLEWVRASETPVLVSSPGTWDEGVVTTCSIVPLAEELIMFYGARDKGIGVATCSRKDLTRWQKRPDPVLVAGKAGTFDAGGVLSPAIVPLSDSLWYMYYVGYDPTRLNGPVKLHQIGLAKSTDAGRTWQRVGSNPVLEVGERGSFDGATISSNSVLKVGDRWYSWYTGISQYPYLGGVCLATSRDGIRWQKHTHNPVLNYNPYVAADAFLVATPHVLYEEGVFKMWYNSRGYGAGTSPSDYHIGYAESLDGIHWERAPRLPVLAGSGRGWDSQMAEYPEVHNLDGRYVMWYSGDGYGSIGYAEGRAVTQATLEVRTGRSSAPDSGWSEWSALTSAAASPFGRPGDTHAQLRIGLRSRDRSITPMVQQLSVRSA